MVGDEASGMTFFAKGLSPSEWRGLLECVRSVAFELSTKNGIAVTRKSVAVDLWTVKEPVRLGLPG